MKVLSRLYSIIQYSKCSKILKASHLLKRSRQTVQTQSNCFLKKQSDQGLPVCYSDKDFVNSSLENQNFI